MYSTLDDILVNVDYQTLVELTDDNGTGEIEESAVSQAISSADAEIDAYLCSRYEVPLSQVPPIIRRLSADGAVYMLFARRMKVPEVWQRRREECVRLLEQLARGVIGLGIDPEPAGGVQTIRHSKEASSRTFDDGTLAPFIDPWSSWGY